MGGGVEVGKALEWMIASSGGGDFVVIRVTGGDDYNEYLYRNLGGVDSVETLRIDSEALVYNEAVAQTIRDAEALFIAGGDQYDYVSLWKDTPIEDAINYLRNNKRVPIGGTSAGSAIQGEIYFDAAKGTIRSEDAMANPYDNRVSLRRGGFLSNPYLEDTITDTHYNNPDRRGRHLTFMARMVIDWDIDARGIGIDERTAVVIEADGRARVFGRGDAFFMQIYDRSGPERCEPGRSLDWFRDRRAVEGYKIRGNRGGDRYFDLRKWDSGSGGSWRYYYVDRGRLGVSR
ncbi:MAG: cyanophycinase [Myxococcota bacterium]